MYHNVKKENYNNLKAFDFNLNCQRGVYKFSYSFPLKSCLQILTSAPIGAWDVLGNYDKPTNQPTDGHEGS